MPGPIRPATFVGSYPSLETLPPAQLPEIALAGRSNVGKSSAINALLARRKLARVSRTPGRTQTINLYEIEGLLRFADLPGYGFARVPDAVRAAWKVLVEGYLGQRDALMLVVALVDATLPAQPMDIGLLAGMVEARLPVIGVATRVDRLGKAARKPQLSRLAEGLGLPEDGLIPFSSVTGEGTEELWDVVDHAISRKSRAPRR